MVNSDSDCIYRSGQPTWLPSVHAKQLTTRFNAEYWYLVEIYAEVSERTFHIL